MKHFLLKLFIAGLTLLLMHLGASLFADGGTDNYYLHFTGEQRCSLIIGTSRSAQGLVPEVINEELASKGHAKELYNFSFTIGHSPYGPAYLRAIKEKHDPTCGDGLFIVSVDPWGLSTDKGEDGLPEEERTLGQQCLFNRTPNYEYLLRHYSAGWGSLIAGPLHGRDAFAVVSASGWTEVRIDQSAVAQEMRAEKKLDAYRRNVLPAKIPSKERLASLSETIVHLQKYGKVALVRIPVIQGMYVIEQELWPTFNDDIEKVAQTTGTPYWNLMPQRDRYTYTDGNHVTPEAARELSLLLAERIRKEILQDQAGS